MSLLDRINKVSDNANARKAWFGLVVAIFVCIIVVPSIYVVTQMFTDWDGISDVLADSDIAVLNCRHGADRIGTADNLLIHLGQSPMGDLALSDQVSHDTCDLLNRHIGILPVLIIEVDMVGLQTAQTSLN